MQKTYGQFGRGFKQKGIEMKPHKHAELIKAWADGAEIEFRFPGTGVWLLAYDPNWDGDIEYRINPPKQVVRYKRYLNKASDGTVYAAIVNDLIGNISCDVYPCFVRWIDDEWQEVVV